jgi:hypothetical protein
MMYEVTTKYQQNFLQWLNSETESQKLGLSDVFEWQWFITMTSKDTMTKNGARLMMTRFLGMYLNETKTEDVQCFWVAEPHNLGKEGYHVHALLQTKWKVPNNKRSELNLALMLDDIYQRAMGVTPAGLDYKGNMRYLDKWGHPTNKHRFRAERYAKTRGEYCAKYVTKSASLWEFARITQDEVSVIGQQFEMEGNSEMTEKECNGNWNKKLARKQTRDINRTNSIRSGNKLVRLKELLGTSELNFAKFSKLRYTERSLEIGMAFEPKPGIKIFA